MQNLSGPVRPQKKSGVHRKRTAAPVQSRLRWPNPLMEPRKTQEYCVFVVSYMRFPIENGEKLEVLSMHLSSLNSSELLSPERGRIVMGHFVHQNSGSSI